MDIRQKIFHYRSYIPIPFLILMVWKADPRLWSLAAGALMIGAGEFLRLWGVAIAGSETRTTGPVGGTFLITTGPFAHVRNPLYLGNILIYTGFGVMSRAFFPWLALVALIISAAEYTLIVSLEEEYLAGTFGEEYARYRASVPRFLPSLKQYPPGDNEQPELDWRRGFASEKRTLQAIGIITFVILLLWRTGG